jgi:hypothetical protein
VTQVFSDRVHDLLDLFGGSRCLLVSDLIETGAITLKDLKALQSAQRPRAAARAGRESRCMSASRACCTTATSTALRVGGRPGRVCADVHPPRQRPTKYSIWVAAALNFVVPVGAVLDKIEASHLASSG